MEGVIVHGLPADFLVIDGRRWEARQRIARQGFLYDYEPAWVWIEQRMQQQQCINRRKDRYVCTDSESDCEDHDRREALILAQLTDGVAEILPERLKRIPFPHFSAPACATVTFPKLRSAA